jgi:hypothetical protein
MTADEARQLESLARNVGELTKAVVDSAVATGRMQEQIRTLFEQQTAGREEEIRYRERQDRQCNDRHSRLEIREEHYDNRQRGLLGFESRVGGAVAAGAGLATMLGAVAAFGRILEAW